MPKITVKYKHIAGLHRLGIYDIWFENFKTQWEDMNKNHINSLKTIYDTDMFSTFIIHSFTWKYAPQ